MDIPDFQNEKNLKNDGYSAVIGIDEAGRGPLAGPVVAAACTLKDVDLYSDENFADTNDLWNYIRDSKKVSEKKREEVYEFILEHYNVGVGVVTPETIDRINILEATFLAMKNALTDLDAVTTQPEKEIILVDGNMIIPHLSRKQKSVTKGDARVKCIAAASIIAKVTRDRKMSEYGKVFPQYGFESHKGYGTKLHMEALQKYGATPIHRKSFAPVKKVIAKR